MKKYYSDDTNGVSLYNCQLRDAPVGKGQVDLIVTSPPYNVGIDYKNSPDEASYEDYLVFTEEYLEWMHGVSADDGRLCLNIPLDKNKGGQQAVLADITKIAQKVGWRYHSTIIWNEGNISRRTAWGSWMSASAPYVIAPVETIVVLYKRDWKKAVKKPSDIEKQEFMDWTNGLWTFNGQSKKGAGGHPAAFPLELPRRCIKLFSRPGDVVLDPFVGSGTTVIVAASHGRESIGIDVSKEYCDIAIKRITDTTNQFEMLGLKQ